MMNIEEKITDIFRQNKINNNLNIKKLISRETILRHNNDNTYIYYAGEIYRVRRVFNRDSDGMLSVEFKNISKTVTKYNTRTVEYLIKSSTYIIEVDSNNSSKKVFDSHNRLKIKCKELYESGESVCEFIENVAKNNDLDYICRFDILNNYIYKNKQGIWTTNMTYN